MMMEVRELVSPSWVAARNGLWLLVLCLGASCGIAKECSNSLRAAAHVGAKPCSIPPCPDPVRSLWGWETNSLITMSKKTDGPPTEAKHWLKLFESSALYKHEPSRLFEDYLDLVLCCLANQQQEARYLEVAKRYTREELENISQLWAYHLMIHEHQVAARGWYDMLGDIYMDMAGRSKTSRMGQFFTPAELCTVIAQLQFGDPEEARGKTCLDPCVGSGRMLLAMHSLQPDLGIVVGADLDRICAKMCAVNFWLHGIRGEVAHMNTLSQEWYFAWQTHPRATWPFVTFLDEDRKLESVLYQERHQLPQAPATPSVPDLFSQAEEPEPSWNKPKYEPKTCRWRRQELQHERPGVVFLFRHGNEYEVFGVDAKTVAAEFGLELRRTEHLVPVVVFPWEALNDVLPWLVRSGERVAIVDPDSADAPWEDSQVAEDGEPYGDPPLPKTHYVTFRGCTGAEFMHYRDGHYYSLDGTWSIAANSRGILHSMRVTSKKQQDQDTETTQAA